MRRDGHGRAGIADIGPDKAGADGDGQYTPVFLTQLIGMGQDSGQGTPLGSPVIQSFQNGGPPNQGAGSYLPVHGALEQIGGFHPPFVLIDMRVSPVGDDDIGQSGPGVRYVGMDVEADGDGNLRPG